MLVERMRRDLQEARGWFTRQEFSEAIALAQLAPGPLAAQLATYLGFVHYGVLGATLVSLAFVLPSFVMVVALGWAYVAYGGLSWVQAVFYSVGAAVIGIIGRDLPWPVVQRVYDSGQKRLSIHAPAALAGAMSQAAAENLISASGADPAALLGGPAAAAVVVLSTPYRSDASAARATLGAALAALAPLEELLMRAGGSVAAPAN